MIRSTFSFGVDAWKRVRDEYEATPVADEVVYDTKHNSACGGRDEAIE